MTKEYRPLSKEQIEQLTRQGCSCADWSKVKALKGFDPSKVKTTHFSGNTRLGIFEKQIAFFGGLSKPAGITNATIHNCTIGNNVYINKIGNYIANYCIEDDVTIDNVDLLAVDKESTFGNGTEVVVVNEGGGREVLMYDQLSAHTAYIMAFYRHRPRVIEKLSLMIKEYTKSVSSAVGLIGKGSRLANCKTI